LGAGVRNPGGIINLDRHARRGQGLDAPCVLTRRSLVVDQPYVDAVFLRADQRFDNARARRQPLTN
jgi:hypothetical protein